MVEIYGDRRRGKDGDGGRATGDGCKTENLGTPLLVR